MKKRVLIPMLATACVTLAPSAALGQSCAKDMDCAGEAVCEGGVCVGADGQPVSAAAAPGGAAGAVAAAAPAPAATVKVEFVSRGEPTTVTSSGQSCVTPCTLNMVPGSRTFRIGNRDHTMMVPNRDSRFSVREATNGLIAGGIALLGIGVVGVAVGLPFTIIGNKEDDPSTRYDESNKLGTIGNIALATGAAMLVPGILMLAVSDTGRPRPVGSAPRITPVAAALPGGGFLGLRFSM